MENIPSNDQQGKRAVIIRLDHLGDILLCTPLIRALSKANIKVDFVGPDTIIPILKNNPHIHNLVGISSICPSFPQHWIKLGNWLRAQNYDILILPFGKPTELLMASFMSGIKIRIAMWSGLMGRFTLHTCLRSGLPNLLRHFSEIVLEALIPLNIKSDGLNIDIFLTQSEISRSKETLRRHLTNCTRFVGIHPGSSGNACNLPPKQYGLLANSLLQDPSVGIIATGSEHENALLREWPRSVLESARFWNSMGKLSLRELSATIAQMNVLCVGSTGPLHIASGLQIPTVSPFCNRGVLSDSLWGNLGAPNATCKPHSSSCQAYWEANKQCCDMRGEVSGSDLYIKTTSLLNAQA